MGPRSYRSPAAPPTAALHVRLASQVNDIGVTGAEALAEALRTDGSSLTDVDLKCNFSIGAGAQPGTFASRAVAFDARVV